jgi:Flp pilus assembly protein TadG
MKGFYTLPMNARSTISIGSNKSQDGLSFLELAIVLPLFILVLFAVTDLGLGLIDYLRVSQIVHESTRHLATIPNLEEMNCSRVPSSDDGISCTNITGTSVSSNDHKRVFEKAILVTNLQKGKFEINNISTSVQLDNTGDIRDDTVKVSINATYNGFFPLFRFIPIYFEARSPYMY